MVKLLILDNLDSFTYNLVELIRSTGIAEQQVITAGEYTMGMGNEFEKIIFSPGPGLPSEYPLMQELLAHYGKTKCILGICLGHQAIAEYFGAGIYNLEEVIHGKDSILHIVNHSETLFRGIEGNSTVGLYHSWAVSRTGLPSCLEVTAESSEGLIMGLRHKTYSIKGLQFHPESFITSHGKLMIENWLGE